MRKSKLQSVLLIPDTHVPYHDRRAWELMISVAKDVGFDTIAILGDFLDFYSVSSHSKDPRRSLKLAEEIESAHEVLTQLDKLGAKRKLFVAGNHEDRLTRYLQDKAPELFDLVSIPDLLHLKKRGWEYTPYKEDARIGKLYLTHDVGTAGRNAVFKALDTYQHCVVTGHTHRIAYVVEGSAAGERRLSAMFGWLGDTKQADYMHRVKAAKDWSLGFGVAYVDPKTSFAYVMPIPIIAYTCVVNGKIYRG